MARPSNPRFPLDCTITRAEKHDPRKDESEEGEIVVYKGKCRVYDKNTTSDKGEVITSNKGLSLPVTRDGWLAAGIIPTEGDMVVVDNGGKTIRGSVIDVNPGNFGGTHIVFNYDRK